MTRKTITNQLYIKVIKGLMDTSKNVKEVVLQKNITYFKNSNKQKKTDLTFPVQTPFPLKILNLEPHQILLGKVMKINMVTVYFNYFQIL